jgi:EAL domain-containing protein (putative c-di-GMP-specific phosphodiesterase class I)
LSQALAGQELTLVYQPIVTLSDGRPRSCEALLRWDHPSFGLLRPAVFLAVAVDAGLMPQLEEWVLRNALAEALAWPDYINVAVNVSPDQVCRPGWINLVLDAVSASGVSADRLELEITETTAPADGNLFSRALHQLRRRGVKIAIDDFGTGHSSLARLQMFPFDKIKIDRSFVTGLTHRADSRAIVKAAISLAHDLGVTATAEGVEARSQAQLLQSLGCTEGQGFLFGPTWPKSSIRTVLREVGAAP